MFLLPPGTEQVKATGQVWCKSYTKDAPQGQTKVKGAPITRPTRWEKAASTWLCSVPHPIRKLSSSCGRSLASSLREKPVRLSSKKQVSRSREHQQVRTPRPRPLRSFHRPSLQPAGRAFGPLAAAPSPPLGGWEESDRIQLRALASRGSANFGTASIAGSALLAPRAR